MKLLGFLLLIISSTLTYVGCKKENSNNWSFCEGCELSVWDGLYEGSGDFYGPPDTTQASPTEVLLVINNTYDNQLEISVSAPTFYSEKFYGSKSDTKYYYNLSGDIRSVQLNLYQKDSEYKINGVSQIYHWEYDAVNDKDVRIIDKSLTFEVYKQIN